MTQALTERYADKIARVLSCHDRLVITRTLPRVLHGRDDEISQRQRIRIFDYAKFAVPLRDQIRENAARLAAAARVTIQHIAKAYSAAPAKLVPKAAARRCEPRPTGSSMPSPAPVRRRHAARRRT